MRILFSVIDKFFYYLVAAAFVFGITGCALKTINMMWT